MIKKISTIILLLTIMVGSLFAGDAFGDYDMVFNSEAEFWAWMASQKLTESDITSWTLSEDDGIIIVIDEQRLYIFQ